MRRYVIIIGAMKSGTTTLFDLLARHPEIAPCIDKEPGFFAFDDVWRRGFEWFDTLFDFDPAVHRYRLEASTDYTKAPFVDGVWERMTALPDVEVKLLYIMRHPLRRIESHAHHTQRKKREIGREGVSPKTDHGLDAGLSPVSLMVSAYASQLDRFAAARAAGNLHCLALEDLKTDPDGTLAAIWAFLGLEPVSKTNEIAALNTAARIRLHPAWTALTRNRRLLEAAKFLLPDALRDRIKSLFRRNIHAEGRFELSEAECKALATLLAGEMKQLRETYGIDTRGLWGL